MMKKILYIAVALLTLSSCNKWFDVEPKGENVGEEIFTKEAAYRDYLNGIYAELATANLYGSNLTLGGVEFMGQTLNPVTSNMQSWASLDFSSANARSTAKNIYEKLYFAIFECNDFLELMARHPEVQYVEGSGKMMNAEVRALRAMLHFELLRLFSPAYSVDKTATNIDWSCATNKSEKMTSEQLTAKIIDELDDAAAELEVYDPVVTGVDYDTKSLKGTLPAARRWKLNYYAAQAVKARALISVGTQASSGDALTALKTIIESDKYKFVNTTSSSTDLEFSTEFLFGLPSPATGFSGLSQQMFAIDGVTISATNVLPATMGANDRRKKWYNTAATNIQPKFAPTALIANWEMPPAIPMVKLGEVYLMAAEAAAVSVSAAKGVEYYNNFITERNSAELALPANATLAQLASAVAKQYIYEFIGEGVRFFHSKRTNSTLTKYDNSGSIANMGSRSLPIVK